MSRKIGAGLGVILTCCCLAGCSDDNRPSTRPSGPQTGAASDPDPHWVVQHNPPAKVALVYVHGVFGDMIGTWTADNGKTFFDLVEENPATQGKADAFVFGFPSYVLNAGSFDIREAANRLDLRLESQGVLNYPAIVFVAHSMGGLVVLQELLTHRDAQLHRDALLDKVPVVVFYATPMEGSLIAAIGQHFSPNTALAQMTEADGNKLLQTLSDQWRSIPDARRPHVRCAYEKKPVGPVTIVPWSSATRFCEGATPAIEADHISIVKPDRAGADAIQVLVSALNDYVLNRSLEAKLETPDFTSEGKDAVFVLHNALGKQTARLVNNGGSPLSFTLAEISDPTTLYLWPDDTPRDIEAHNKVDLGVALSRAATATEYHFVLRTSVAPDKRVIVRVPDLPAIKAQQSEIARSVASAIQGVLADPKKSAPFISAPADDQKTLDAVVQIAQTAVAKESPGLPANAQWVLTADLLASMNWPTLAARALRKAEHISPATARSPSVQYLAGIIAAQSGQRQIFASVPTAVASVEAVVDWKAEYPLRLEAASDVAANLAVQMTKVPSLRALGYSLDGDLQLSKGNAKAALVAYREAAKIQPTPSLSMRVCSSLAACKPKQSTLIGPQSP